MLHTTTINKQLDSLVSLVKKILVFIIILFAASLCGSRLLGQPSISSFNPNHGPIGTTVIISGSNYGSTRADNIVYFGATRATVSNASETSLTVIVPDGATYEPITVTANGLTTYAAAAFVVTFQGNAGPFTSSSFAPKVDFSTEISPADNLLSDLDGDGKPDIITCDYNSPVVLVYRNTSLSGNIAFATKKSFSITGDQNRICIGDLDGDGKTDIVSATPNLNTVSILRNTSIIGNVSFDTKKDFATGTSPAFGSIGDIDGDGKPDIVVPDFGSNSFSVLRNTSTIGNISFASKIDFATGASGANPFHCAIGDLDGDGKPDVAVAYRHTVNYISVFRNTSIAGVISFAAKSDCITGTDNPNGVSIGDIDGDGKQDLVVASFGENFEPSTISIFRNKSSSGSLSFETTVNFPTGGAGSDRISINDLNGDGKPDLAVNNYWSDVISVLRNMSSSGHISFDSSVLYSVGSGPVRPTTSDLDGDHDPDIAIGNIFSGNISVLSNEISYNGSFTLVNANTDKDIQAIPDGSVLDKTALPANLNIRANTTPTKVGSVVFILDGQKVRTENGFPYALAGDFPSGDYLAWSLPLGDHTLTAIPYSNHNGQGTQGTPFTIHFTVIGPRVSTFTLVNANTDKDIQAIPDGSVLDKTALPPNLNIRANTTPTKVGSVVFILDGQKVRTENGFPYALAGDFPSGDYLAWSLPFGDHTLTAIPYSNHNGQGIQGTSLTIHFTVIGPRVNTFTLVNANTDKDIQPIPDGSILIKTALPPDLNIRANTTPTKVGSVVFILDGQKVRTENGFPYALAGDFPSGDYLAWSLPLGDHTLTAIPYSNHNGTGSQGASLTINFTVTAPQVKYCNGVAYDPDIQGCCVDVIYNIYEQQCTSCGLINYYEKCAPPCGIISIEQSCCLADSTPYATGGQDCTACGVSQGSGVEKCTPCGYVPLDQPLECCEALLTVYDTLTQKCTPCGIIPIDQDCDQLVSKAVANKPNFVDEAAGVKLSPNPVHNTLHVTINGQQYKTSELYILSASGVVIKNIHSVTSSEVPLDISSLVNGVYFIKVISGEKVMYKRFVKL